MILDLVRPEIRALSGYQAALPGAAVERLHANEVPWRLPGDTTLTGLNRYPEPQPGLLLDGLARRYGVEPGCLLVTRGSDDAIDLVTRAFCRAGRDAVLVTPPTFEMYAHAARIQGASVIESPLSRGDFALDVERVLAAYRPEIKIVFLCSPNNPTGNRLEPGAVLALCQALADRALLVVDEAYIEFAGLSRSLIAYLAAHENLVILRTLSKAFALAGARCGVLLGQEELIALLARLLPPYPLPSTTIEAVSRSLDEATESLVAERIAALCRERDALKERLAALPTVQRVWPSEANFLLLQSTAADRIAAIGCNAGILVRDLTHRSYLDGCLRITVGTAAQNAKLCDALERAL